MVKTRKGALSLLLALALCLGLMSPAIAAEEMGTQPETGSTWEKETQPGTDSAEEKDTPSETGLAGEEDTLPETGSAGEGDPQPETGSIAANETQPTIPEAHGVEPHANDNRIECPVTGGSLYFDESTGTITSCDSSVTEAVIPSMINEISVTSIGGFAFYNCTSLASVTIPGSVASIMSSAFEGCSSLTSVNIPSSVTKIDYSTFKGCTNLREIDIPDSVEVIESYAFQDCEAE